MFRYIEELSKYFDNRNKEKVHVVNIDRLKQIEKDLQKVSNGMGLKLFKNKGIIKK